MNPRLDYSVKLALASGVLLTPVRPRSKEYIDAFLTIETFDQWLAAKERFGHDINAAVHLAPSNLCVVDFDRIDGLALLSEQMVLPSTMMVHSARGFHLYYRRPGDLGAGYAGNLVVNRSHLGEYLCGNNDWHYALLPGSIHPSGAIYQWLNPPSDGIALLPHNIHYFVEPDSVPYPYGA